MIIQEKIFQNICNRFIFINCDKRFCNKITYCKNTLSNNTKGGIYECVIADILSKKGYKLYFYKNERTKMEIDIIIQKNGKLIPIEVKSKNSRAISLKQFVKNNSNILLSYKLIDGNIGVSEDNIIAIPLYMAIFI